MPLYELKCPVCDEVWEEFSPVKDRNEQECHNQEHPVVHGKVQISLSNPYVIKSGWNKDIEQHVTGPKQYRKFLKDNHMEEVYGKAT